MTGEAFGVPDRHRAGPAVLGGRSLGGVRTMIEEPEPSEPPECGETAVFWPDAEACDARCWLYSGHSGPHEDPVLGWWES